VDDAAGGGKMATALSKVVRYRGAAQSITIDNGTKFCSKAIALWPMPQRHSDFIRPGRPVGKGYIESFNGKLLDEFLNAEVFFNLVDARRKFATSLRTTTGCDYTRR
jgi:putative transposase